jgi:hypothetical protein
LECKIIGAVDHGQRKMPHALVMFVEQGLLEALARGRRVSPPKNRLDPKHLGVSPYFAPRNAIAQALTTGMKT